MVRSTQALASFVGLLLIVAPIVGSMGGLGVDAATSTQTKTTNATAISECQVINESGTYELTTDLVSNETCLQIRASNVTIKGNGYTINETGNTYRQGDQVRESAIGVFGEWREPQVTNVTIRNLTVNGSPYGLDITGSTDVTIRNVTADNSTVQIEHSSNVSLTDSTVTNDSVNLDESEYVEVRRVTLLNSTVDVFNSYEVIVTEIDGRAGRVHVDMSRNVTVQNSSLQLIRLQNNAQNMTFANNGADAAGWFAIKIRYILPGDEPTITGNNLTGNAGEQGMAAALSLTAVHNATITNNTITGNDIGILTQDLRNRTTNECVNGEQQSTEHSPHVEIHHNAIADNTVGIRNEDTQPVNATYNYWGATNGPSSATEEVLEDPETGTLADGDGTTVSEHPDQPGVSNVRFDPWLDTNPTNSTAS